jgi:autotransporter-associated beta strand protein
VYSLSNRSLQFLSVVLPDKAELMAVTVSGEAVRADEETRNGRRVRLIPLIQTKAGERSMEVKLVYRLRGSGLPKQVKLDDPELVGISAERTVWNASLPPGWTLKDASRETFGNMEPIAEEGRDIEKLQSWMSDLGRINRVLSSSKNYDDNNAALAEAEKLNKDINELTQKVQSKRQSRYSVKTEDEKVAKQFEAKTDNDLSKVTEELGKQALVLTENRKQNNTFAGKQVAINGLIGNGWAANTYEGKTTINAGTLQVERGQALNDNVSVANSFFGDVMVVGSGGTLTLSGVNTFTGGITVSGGALTMTPLDRSMAVTTNSGQMQLSSNNIQHPVFNNSNAFGFSSNARAATGGNSSNAPVETPALVALNSSASNFTVGGVVGAGNLSTSNVAGVTATNSRDAFGGRGAGGGFDKAGGDAQLSRGMRFGQAAIVPDSIDGALAAQPSGGLKAEAMVAQTPAPAAPPPMPAAAVPMSPADPFAAPAKSTFSGSLVTPVTPLPVLTPKAEQAVDMVIAQIQQPSAKNLWASQPGAIRATGVKDAYVTTAAVNQLRPTGRRSLQVEVPLVGETYHFRKLKDHAVLDLIMKKESTGEKTMQSMFFSAGLGAWALMSLIAAKRRKQVRA